MVGEEQGAGPFPEGAMYGAKAGGTVKGLVMMQGGQLTVNEAQARFPERFGELRVGSYRPGTRLTFE
jgi:hypothetical protein